MSDREAKVEVTTDASGMDRGLDDARRKTRAYDREEMRAARAKAREIERLRRKEEREAARARKEVLHAGRSLLGSVKQGVGIGLGMKALGGIEGVMNEVLDFEKSLVRLQIASNSSGTAMRALASDIDSASRLTGIGRNDILGAAAAFVSLTGDMDTARGSIGSWAKIAAATGSTMEDIATSSATLSQQLGIAGAGQFEVAFSALAASGKAGAIELSNMAGELSNILPQWIEFGNAKAVKGNVQSVRELAAALQVVRGGASSASETTTRMRALLTSFVQNASKFKDAGVDVFKTDPKTGAKTLRGVMEIVDRIGRSKLAKDPTLLAKALGSAEARSALIQLRERRDLVEEIIRASADGLVIQRDFATYMESPSAKIERSWNNIKMSIVSAFTPERVKAFADALGFASDKFAKVMKLLEGNTKAEVRDESIKQILASAHETDLSLYQMKDLAIAAQNYSARDDVPDALAPGFRKSQARLYGLEGMPDDVRELIIREVGERLGKEYNAISPGMIKHQAERREAGIKYLEGIAGPGLINAMGVRNGDPKGPIQTSTPATIDTKKLAAEFAAALSRIGIVVKVGDEPIAKAARNARGLNTRPGGRP